MGSSGSRSATRSPTTHRLALEPSPDEASPSELPTPLMRYSTKRAPQDVSQPTSPRAAASRWYGRPASGPDSGLFSWTKMPDGIDRHIHVVLQASDKEGAPTIDVMDDGIGIETAGSFHNTILSLQAGNKIRKRYLIGTFGQGGASTLGFCDFAIVISRAKSAPNMIAFTIIRVLHLDASYKDDCYAFLAVGGPALEPRVLEAAMGNDTLDIYDRFPGAKLPNLARGTIVRHIAYRLTNRQGAPSIAGQSLSPSSLHDV